MASLLGIGGSGALLAQEPASEPVGFGGRIEVPEVGYAITAPDGWVSIRPSAEDVDSITDALQDIDADLAATVEEALAAGVGFSLLTFGPYDEASGFRENCNVTDLPSDGTPVDVAVASDAAVVAEMGDQVSSGPETALLDLPAGKVGRLDFGMSFPGFETMQAVYYFTDGSTYMLLTCTHVERPEDDWLSIAETFEFLPAE
jgi:hypothetical protein